MLVAIKEAEAQLEEDWMMQMDMQLRYHLKITTAELNDMDVSEWIRLWVHLKHIREQEAKTAK